MGARGFQSVTLGEGTVSSSVQGLFFPSCTERLGLNLVLLGTHMVKLFLR